MLLIVVIELQGDTRISLTAFYSLTCFQAVHFVAAGGTPDSALALLEAKAKVDEINVAGITPLMCSASNGNVRVLQILLQAGATTRVQDK